MSTHRSIRVAVLVALLLAATGCGNPPAASPGVPSAPFGTAIALPADFPLGSWAMTVTEQDLRQAGIDHPGLLAENIGTYTKTYVADGTWTVVAETPVPVRWPVFRGTFRMTSAGEIEETTIFPSEYAGEVIRFTWQREGSAVLFRVLDPPDQILPVLTESHPWQPK